MQSNKASQELHLKEYYRVVWKRRWLVVTVLGVTLLSTILGIAAKTPLFTGTAELLVERDDVAVSRLGGYNVSVYEIGQLLDTYAHIFKTQDFLEKVADELQQKLALQEAQKSDGSQDLYAREPLHWMFSNLRTVTHFYRDKVTQFFADDSKAEQDAGPADLKLTRKGDRPYTAEKLGRSIKVRVIPRTQIIEIRADDPDPNRAALIANTAGATFIKEKLNRRLNATSQAVMWLQNQLKHEQGELDNARIELYNFMQQFGILSLDETRSTKLDEELLITKEKLREAKQKTEDLKLRYEQALSLSKAPGRIDTIPEAAANEILTKIRTEEMTLEQESIKLASTYGANHPKVKLITKQLSNIRESKNREIQKIINSLKYQYEAALAHVNSLANSGDALQKQLEDIKKKTIRYYTLKREVDSSEKVYDALLNRFKETGLSEEIGRSTNISIIESASPPLMPSSPNIPRTLAVGMVLALSIGVGLAFLLEYLDNTVTRPEQVEQNLGLTFLGAVPLLQARDASAENGDGKALIPLEAKSSGSEAYRALRTNILLSSADEQPQVLLLTSPGKGEGKTTTAASLAAVMAQAGNRVLLMDCDLRRPRVHKMFGLDRDHGLSILLAGKTRDYHGFAQKTDQPNLEVITCGPIPPNPSELLGSKRMLALMESIRQDYERIILDTPPILAATDAAVLTPLVDGTVLVVKAGDTSRQTAQRAIKMLTDLKAKIVGVVLNGIMLGKNGYYYYDYYYYQYGHYYGEEETKEKSSWFKKRMVRKSVEKDETPM
jgi:capsular exopolysaccharide synthesis family protein